ncbi:MAG: glycerophosphodiester phosphodiesterase [Tumebacillaceae bacterium]
MQYFGRRIKNFAHRGASGHAPENTMAAFRLAEQQGANGFELDVQVTSDGVPVVIHDELLDRTTNGHGLVLQHTLAEIRALDAGSWYGSAFVGEKIPTLEEVMLTFGQRMQLNIELKNSYHHMPELEEKTIALIRKYRMEKSVVVSSFHHGSMQRMHQLAPDIRTALLYDCCLVDAIDYAKRLGASALHPFYATVREALIEEAHHAGIEVGVWTVNEPDAMERMIAEKVDTIITNYPDRLRTILHA